MKKGDAVQVGSIGGRWINAKVLYERGSSVRVQLADGRHRTVPAEKVRLADGREKTVPADRVRAERSPVVNAMRPMSVDLVVHKTVGAELLESLVASKLVAVPKPKPPWRSSAYMAHVRTFECCVDAYSMAEEAHHHGPHAMGRKGPDWTCIPMSHAEHDHFHTSGVFRGMTRKQTDAHAVKAQIECMTAWCEARGLDYMTAVRDALARVVEGDD